MEMTKTLEKAFNEQITLEFEASTVYLQLAIEIDMRDLPGMAAWLRRQADEKLVSVHPRPLPRRDQGRRHDSLPPRNWFIEEQIEEVASVNEIVGRVEMIKDDGPGLLRLDAELGERPVATTEA